MKTIIITIFLVTLFCVLIAIPRDMVVVEIGTGTWCQFCPGAAMGADDLVHNKHRAAILENHNGDAYANTFSNDRNSYYGITGYPTAYFDGTNPSVGGSNTTSLYPGYRTKVNNRLAVPSRYTISAVGTHTGLTYNVAVTVSKVETDTNTNIKLHGVLTESGIQQNWQGQTHLEFVVRTMAPSSSGTPVDFFTNSTQTFNLTFTANAAWNPQHFEFVFFLQNDTTKEILQGCKYNLNALENVYPLSLQNIDYGNVNMDNIYTQTFVLNNWWTQDMNIDISIDNMDFFVYPQLRDVYVVPFMEAMTFEVVFLPSQIGLNHATLTITTDNAAYPSLTLPITANVISTTNQQDTAIPSPSGITAIVPNPFSSSTTIRCNLKDARTAELTIYNLKGAKVYEKSITKSQTPDGNIIWNGVDSNGQKVPAGIYMAILKTDDGKVSTSKLICLR